VKTGFQSFLSKVFFSKFNLYRYAAVGASSAIFGLVGALGVYLQRHSDLFGAYGERQLHNLVGSIGANAAFGLMSSRIDNW
jgi:membrane associated rhomboid family serine protease